MSRFRIYRQFSAVFLLLLIVFLGYVPAIRSAEGTQAEESNISDVQENAVQEIVYVVKPGDSLYRIASKYKVHVYELRQWNNLSQYSLLRPGQEIKVKRVDYPPVEGLASWYGPNFHGKNMANTEVYNMYDIVVAHRTLPLGYKVKITNLENGKSIVAPVLDRGPYVKNGLGEYTREIDLSYGVALELGTIKKGVVRALVEPLNEPLPIN